MSQISPIVLRAQITPPSGGGSFGLADTTVLENPFQGPMWLDEIRFSMSPFTASNAWGSFKVELKLGDVPLTNGFVPMSLLGKMQNCSTVAGETSNAPHVFIWKLPKPLFIPTRELLRPTMYYDNVGAPAQAQTITITYACRPLPKDTPTPKKLHIPWVSYFKPVSVTTPGATDRTDHSTPADIFNPFKQDLHIQRFVGRLMGNIVGGANKLMDLASAKIDLATSNPTVGTFVSAQDSFNNILIRDPTPFAHVFDVVDMSWTVNCTLPPQGFYVFTIDRLWSGYGGTFTGTIGIAMISYREVDYLS